MQALSATVLIALAVWQAVEVLRHAEIARRVRVWAWAATASQWRVARFFGKVLLCPFCLSHWVALLLVCLWCVCSWPVILLAAVRLANVGNDLVGDRCRTPRANTGEERGGETETVL